MHRFDAEKSSQTLDDAIIDQDFDDWQASADLDEIDQEVDALDLDDSDFDDFARDSHFLMRELDFVAELDRL